MPDLLEKQPAESRLYTMDFSPKMDEGQVINGVTSVVQVEVLHDGSELPSTDLTLEPAATHSLQEAQQRIGGGVDGKTYKITYLVTTSVGDTLEADGLLLVRDA